MTKGERENKHSRQITMSVTAAISPNESNWGWRGGCLGFLVYLFSGGPLGELSQGSPNQTRWEHDQIHGLVCQNHVSGDVDSCTYIPVLNVPLAQAGGFIVGTVHKYIAQVNL